MDRAGPAVLESPRRAPDETGDAVNAARVAARYTEGVDVYTETWAPVLRSAVQPLLGRLPLGTARTVVDVGCGPGTLLDDLRVASPEAVVIGVDRTRVALARARAAGHRRLAVMDAVRPALRPGSADVVVSCFMLFHLPDPGRGLRRLRALLRPSGAVGVAVWAAGRGCAATDLFDLELDAAGVAEAPDAPVYSDTVMDTPGKLAALLRRVGLTEAGCWTTALDHRWDPVELLGFCCGFGERRRRLAQLPEEARRRFTARMMRMFAGLAETDLTERSRIVLGCARRPAGTPVQRVGAGPRPARSPM